MKNVKSTFALALCLLSAGALVSCGGGSSDDPNAAVVKVKMYKGGYGRNWFDQIASKYKELKKSQGKSVRIEVVDYSKTIGDAAKNEILTVTDNDTDLYLLDGPEIHDIISQSYRSLGTNKYALLEPMDDIMKMGAIGFDGTEENETIASRLFAGYAESIKYHNVVSVDKWEGKSYSLPWADAVTGFICNKPILDSLGLQVPVTSNELLNVVKAISGSSQTSAKPFVYSGQGAPGYWNYIFNTYFAQYSGYQSYQQFIECVPESGDIEHDGWQVYQNPGFEKALEGMFEILDDTYCVANSGAADYGTAQHAFATGKAVFMANGDWLLNEMSDTSSAYFKALKDSIVMKTPILSSIGPEIGLSDDADLGKLVRMIDEGKANAEIVAAMGGKVTEEGVERVVVARGVHHGEGANHLMVVPSYADQKEYAMEFIRFMYSNDACNLYNSVTYSNLPLKYNIDSSRELTPYQRSLNDIASSRGISMIAESGELNEIRPIGGIYTFNTRDWIGPNTTFISIIQNKKSAAESDRWTPHYVATTELDSVQRQWSRWMGNFNW